MDIATYKQQFQSRGLRLVFDYFKEVHFFDIKNRVDTRGVVWTKDYILEHENLKFGVEYMPSWTREFKGIYKELDSLGLLGDPYIFLDIGCGKRKACLYWRQLDEDRGGACKASKGIDYYKPLVEIARLNSLEMFGDKSHFEPVEATSVPFSQEKIQLVAYMYNPFDENVMTRVISELLQGKILVYTNPVHRQLIGQSGFSTIGKRRGWHQNLNTNIYRKTISS